MKCVLAKHRIVQMQHSTYLPDCKFFLFPQQKIHIIGKKIKDVDDIQVNKYKRACFYHIVLRPIKILGNVYIIMQRRQF